MVIRRLSKLGYWPHTVAAAFLLWVEHRQYLGIIKVY